MRLLIAAAYLARRSTPSIKQRHGRHSRPLSRLQIGELRMDISEF
jgi:hypothetical protein